MHPGVRQRPVDAIRFKEVVEIIGRVYADRSQTTRSRSLSYLKMAFQYGVDYELTTKNAYAPVSVDFMSGDEGTQVLDTLRKLNPALTFPTIVIGEKVLVGFRREEIHAALKEAHLETEVKTPTWQQPDTDNQHIAAAQNCRRKDKSFAISAAPLSFHEHRRSSAKILDRHAGLQSHIFHTRLYHGQEPIEDDTLV